MSSLSQMGIIAYNYGWFISYTKHIYRQIRRHRLTVPGHSRIPTDLKIYTDLYTHCLRGMIVWKNDFENYLY